MVADAFQLDVLAVDEKACVRIKLQRADAKRRFIDVHHLVHPANGCHRDVAIGLSVCGGGPQSFGFETVATPSATALALAAICKSTGAISATRAPVLLAIGIQRKNFRRHADVRASRGIIVHRHLQIDRGRSRTKPPAWSDKFPNARHAQARF